MKFLILGSGGREHAIAKKLTKDNPTCQLYFSPPHAAVHFLPNGCNVVLNNIDEMAEFAKKENITLTIVGGEQLLVQGIADKFQSLNLPLFGATQDAAKLEGSKAFSKAFMKKYNIPTADYETFDNIDLASKYLKQNKKYPIVIKADGLASGKGVVICHNEQQALQCIHSMMVDQQFAQAGQRIVIELFLTGVEASILAITDGQTMLPFVSVKDHKQVGDGDTGPNTGGMGTIAPNPYVTEEVLTQFHQRILQPTLHGFKSEGLKFSGIVFFGLMITKQGPYLLEYNMRFGDPETQVVMALLENNLYTLLSSTLQGNLSKETLKFKKEHAVCVVACAKNYPNTPKIGDTIEIDKKIEDNVLLAGVKLSSSQGKSGLQTQSGRVLNAVGLGNTLEQARMQAYQTLTHCNFEGIHYRKDIGR